MRMVVRKGLQILIDDSIVMILFIIETDLFLCSHFLPTIFDFSQLLLNPILQATLAKHDINIQ